MVWYTGRRVSDVPQYLHGRSVRSAIREQWAERSSLHLADELTAKGVDDTGDGGSLALADEVEVEHSLHSSRLHTAVLLSESPLAVVMLCTWLPSWSGRPRSPGNLLDETSCLWVEESVLCLRAQRPAGSGEALDVVVGGEAVMSVDTVWRSGGHCCGGGLSKQ